jgi:hypothetical protein
MAAENRRWKSSVIVASGAACAAKKKSGLVSVLRLFSEPSSPQRSSQPAIEA